MHKHAKSNLHSRVLIVKKHLEEGVAVAELAAYFDISPSLIYRWLRRYKTLGLQGLKDRSSRPKHCPNRTKSWQEQAIKALALGGWAQTDIAQTLKLPLSTVCVVVHRMCGRLLKRIEPAQRYEYDEPGGLIHFDIKRVARFSKPGHRKTGLRKQMTKGAGWEYVHVCVDDNSRWCHAEVLPRQRAIDAVKFFKRCIQILQAMDVKVKRVLTDNGKCYTSRAFKNAVKGIGARPMTTRPYRPQTNGKAERFIQSLMRDWSYGRLYDNSAQRNAKLPCYLKWYNLIRPHGSLNRQPPISRIFVNNVPEIYI